MTRPALTTVIQAEKWAVEFRRMRKMHGLCDRETKVITLDTALTEDSDPSLREIALHEFFHATMWILDEEVIAQLAREADAFLTDLDL